MEIKQSKWDANEKFKHTIVKKNNVLGYFKQIYTSVKTTYYFDDNNLIKFVFSHPKVSKINLFCGYKSPNCCSMLLKIEKNAESQSIKTIFVTFESKFVKHKKIVYKSGQEMT